jgi:hypothetical protein
VTDAEPKRCEGETRADEVRRRVVETVREQLDEIARRAAERHDVDGTKHGASD